MLTQDRLDELVPIEPAAMKDRQVIEWDKDDIDALKFMKVDVLGLGILGCMRRAFDLLREHKNVSLDLATIPADDPDTYAMIRKADTLGVFQIESRAQMTMLPRIKPETFYDLVIEVAIVRPGPIQGDMVHPYLRRREGKERITYPKPEFEKVLGKTLGVPLFQEQAMRVAIECAGFTACEADQLRRAMATFKFTGGVSHFKDKLISGMEAQGYDRAFAERTFKQLEGFGSYGFPESHAASFALIAYASSWLKCHHPEVFCCALLNAQPMGFYAPAQIVRDAREHGIEVRPIDVNQSRWDCTLEKTEIGRFAVRLGLRMAKGLANPDAARIVVGRGDIPFKSIEELWRRSATKIVSLEQLANADAFAGMGLGRRQATWAVRALRDEPLPLFEAADRGRMPLPEAIEPLVQLKPMTEAREVVEDYTSMGLSLRRHPFSFMRKELAYRKVATCADVLTARDGTWLMVAGLVLVRQMPASASGVLFATIEDETGHANLIIWPSLYEQQRRTVLSASALVCRGKVQREGEVIHVVADGLTNLSDLLRQIGQRDENFHASNTRSDETWFNNSSVARIPHTRDIREPHLSNVDGITVKSRNFR